MASEARYVYFSLGDAEKNSKNTILQTVEKNTMQILEHYRKLGINTFFEFNKGGHFTNGIQRMAKGIASVLKYTVQNDSSRPQIY